MQPSHSSTNPAHPSCDFKWKDTTKEQLTFVLCLLSLLLSYLHYDRQPCIPPHSC